MNLKPFIYCALMLAASTSACMQADLSGEETGLELETAALPEQSDELAAIEDEGSDPAEAEPEGQSLGLLENGESLGQDDGEVPEVGCVYVDWCDEPGYWGTVCIWEACSWDAAVAECYVDAEYVCGTIHYPVVIRW